MTETVSDAVASKIKEARRQRGWTTSALASRCADRGHPEMTKAVIENIESGRRDASGNRRREVTVDELRVLAEALGFSPAAALSTGGLVLLPLTGGLDRESLAAELDDARARLQKASDDHNQTWREIGELEAEAAGMHVNADQESASIGWLQAIVAGLERELARRDPQEDGVDDGSR